MDESTRLLSWMSHELRTPLNAILGYGQLLELDELTGDQRESVEQILDAGRALVQIVDDVLDFARARSGELVLATELVAVGELIAEASERAGLRDFEAPRVLRGAVVRADRPRLTRALSSFLRLADADDVQLTCSGQHRGRLRIEVRGAAVGSAERVFVPFERFPAAADGDGLGLPLARLLVEAMSGSVGAEGGTLWLELPLAPA